MDDLKNLIDWIKNEESGQGMVEYALIIGLVSIAAIVALGLMGGKLPVFFNKAANDIK